jgi:glycosyltransferase involved in cell wall biosynthesis
MGGVVFLCGNDELDKERRGYARAFARVAPLHFIAAAEDWRAQLPDNPIVIINPDGRPWLPEGLEQVKAPTAVFHIDTYVATARRIRWSLMYDYSFVFHPGYEETFRAAGIPGARLLPHAAERDLFDRPEGDRRFDVGWVGATGRSIYGIRGRILAGLQARFATNDVARFYTTEEMADIYRASKIVVNVSRDDYPQDANMRCFEAMAGGALLITQSPSELTALGFEEGVHFFGYRQADEVSELVAYWLARDSEREAIAHRARALVLAAHTYDNRVATILESLHEGPTAPARSWPADRVQALRFDYFVEYADVRKGLAAYRKLASVSMLRAAQRLPGLVRLALKVVSRAFRNMGKRPS